MVLDPSECLLAPGGRDGLLDRVEGGQQPVLLLSPHEVVTHHVILVWKTKWQKARFRYVRIQNYAPKYVFGIMRHIM